MKRNGSAEWAGDLRSGKGSISTESGALDAPPYGFNTRFGDEKGTNPEELIGAAHASCFSMALSNELSKAGIANPRIETTAEVELTQQDSGFAITASHLTVKIAAKARGQGGGTKGRRHRQGELPGLEAIGSRNHDGRDD